MNDTGLRAVLAFLVALTAAVTVIKPVSLKAPAPLAETPHSLALPNYRVDLLAEQPGRQGTNLSSDTLRRWRLNGDPQNPALILTLVSVRARTFPELQVAAFRHLDPDLVLLDRRLNAADQDDNNPLSEQFAIGHGKAKASGASTRLQSCITPGGASGVTRRTLSAQLHQQRQQEDRQMSIGSHVARLAGLGEHSRWECLAVQLSTAATPNSPQQLHRAWSALLPSLAPSRDQGGLAPQQANASRTP